MRIDHRRAHVLVPEEFLDGADVVTVLQQVSGRGIYGALATSQWIALVVLAAAMPLLILRLPARSRQA